MRRVQRVPAEWPILHLEAEPAPVAAVVIDGLVRHPRRFTLDGLMALAPECRTLAVHCVWGWSRTDGVWDGLGVESLLDVVEPLGDWVTFGSSAGAYSSCLPVEDAARGLLAWARDGQALDPMYGGPIRFLPPVEYWAYKGVKWIGRITVGDRFAPGMWESKVADPMGRIPDEVELP